MEISTPEPVKYKGRFLVAQLKKYTDYYTRVLGMVEDVKHPTYGNDQWNKNGTRMVPKYTSRHTWVYCVPVERNKRLDGVLKKLGFKQTKGVVDYWKREFSSYIDEKIVHPKLGFRVIYLALISLEEKKAIMNIVFPPEQVSRKEISIEDLALDLFI